MTAVADFTDEELGLLTRLPRWVVAAASGAQADSTVRTHAEVEAGFVAVANGRQHPVRLVAEFAELALSVYDDQASAIDATTEAAQETVLGQAAAARQVLRAKAPAEAGAYAQWLLQVTDDVIRAARSDDVLGFGGTLVTPAEQRFRDRLAAALT